MQRGVVLFHFVQCLHFPLRLTLGWERAAQSRMLKTGAISGRCAAAPCAWWRPLCDGIVAPPGTL